MKKRLAEEYDAPLTDISRFYTLNQHIGGMKKISKTLLDNWERIPQEKKVNLIGSLEEMAQFCLEMQK